MTNTYDKSPHTIGKWKSRENTKTPSKTSVIQRLRTDLGRSFGLPIVIQFVYGISKHIWVLRFHCSWVYYYNICNAILKDFHLKKKQQKNMLRIKVSTYIFPFIWNDLNINIMPYGKKEKWHSLKLWNCYFIDTFCLCSLFDNFLYMKYGVLSEKHFL